jgi:hypothetical protein
MKKQPTKAAPTASQLITKQIAELNDWRGTMLAELRKLIQLPHLLLPSHANT